MAEAEIKAIAEAVAARIGRSDIALRAALERLDLDGHLFQNRPCPTCPYASKALGRPFGCDRVQRERAR